MVEITADALVENAARTFADCVDKADDLDLPPADFVDAFIRLLPEDLRDTLLEVGEEHYEL